MEISQSPISSPDDTPWGYVKLLKGHTSELFHSWQVFACAWNPSAPLLASG
ncbi:hypothetical protein JHK87_047650 [Glycine soja]|nr:hypothetical protein JHK87_047650 [Glycine soja]